MSHYVQILRAANERLIDLIVLGVHGRNALDRLMFGSTTEHIIRRATCPVLTSRPRRAVHVDDEHVGARPMRLGHRLEGPCNPPHTIPYRASVLRAVVDVVTSTVRSAGRHLAHRECTR